MSNEPRIQYAHTTDDKSIAHWTMGEGTPLVLMPNTPLTHIQLEWTIEECRRWYTRLAAAHKLVRYDGRGFGLSSREIGSYTVDDAIRDLEAVVDRLNLDRFALFASSDSSMPAITYAVRNPDRVSHLIVWCGWARRADVSDTAQTRTLRAMIDQDWEIYTETVARVLLGWHEEDAAKRLAAFYRECTTPDVLRTVVPAVYEWDATPDVPNVRCPVLVIHRKGVRGVDVAVARDLASRFPDAQFALLEGESPLPFHGDTEAVLTAVREFLGDDVADPLSAVSDESAPMTILFTDLEGSTALTQRLGDEKAQELLRNHNAVIREALRLHAGREIKHTGDGIMASFRSASRAIECAAAIQRGITADKGGLRVRIGLNAGEPVADGHDLFGTSVQLASRVCDHAEPGQVLVSNVVRELVAGKGFLFSDRGDVVLRGFEDPVRLFELRWRDEG